MSGPSRWSIDLAQSVAGALASAQSAAAAHIRGVAEKGSDDPRNGLILCKNHHTAFDKDLLCFQPETGAVILRKGISAEHLGVSALALTEELKPHIDALRWRWDRRHREIGGPWATAVLEGPEDIDLPSTLGAAGSECLQAELRRSST